ncbi:MAG TPA: alpha/beta fold hydrolase, partial [Bryobacteraceae bacterium]|nr:alpha/beta fold hydrolase [Bryobacteraceae bacterium]
MGIRVPATTIFLLLAATLAHADYLDIGGQKMYYETCGTGPAVVLLHDGLIHAVTWDGVWDALCGKFHVVRYDRRGYGRSDVPKDRFSPSDDLYALLTHLNLPRAILVGNSSGGALALDFVLDHPRNVQALFLIGPVVHGMLDSAHFQHRGAANSAPLEKGDLKGTAELWSKDKYLIAPGHDSARKQLFDALAQNPKNLRYPGGLEVRVSAVGRLGAIRVPTMILAGEFDIPDVQAYCGAIAYAIPDSRRGVVSGAGHLIQLDSPDELLKRLVPFVERNHDPELPVLIGTLESYAGTYQEGSSTFNVRMRSNRLVVVIPGLPEFGLYGESETKFRVRIDDSDLEFERDKSGKVTQAIRYVG